MKEIVWVIIHLILAIYCQKEYERTDKATDKAYFLVLFILNCVMMAVQTVLFFV